MANRGEVKVITGTVVASGTQPKTVGSTFEKGKLKSVRVFRTKSGVQTLGSLSRRERSRVKGAISQQVVNKQAVDSAVAKRQAVANKILQDISRSRARNVAKQTQLEAIRRSTLSGKFINRQLELLKVEKERERLATAPVTSEYKAAIDAYARSLRQKSISQPVDKGFGTVTVGGVVFSPTSRLERAYFEYTARAIARDKGLKRSWDASVARSGTLVRKGDRFFVKVGKGFVTAGMGLFYSPVFVANSLDKLVKVGFATVAGKRVRKTVLPTLKGVVKQVPRSLWESYNPSKPENWGNIFVAAVSVVQVAGKIKPGKTTAKTITKNKSNVSSVTKKVVSAKKFALKSSSRLAKVSVKNFNKVLNNLRSQKAKLIRIEKQFLKSQRKASAKASKAALAKAKAKGKRLDVRVKPVKKVKPLSKAKVRKIEKKVIKAKRKAVAKEFKQELSVRRQAEAARKAEAKRFRKSVKKITRSEKDLPKKVEKLVAKEVKRQRLEAKKLPSKLRRQAEADFKLALKKAKAFGKTKKTPSQASKFLFSLRKSLNNKIKALRSSAKRVSKPVKKVLSKAQKELADAKAAKLKLESAKRAKSLRVKTKRDVTARERARAKSDLIRRKELSKQKQKASEAKIKRLRKEEKIVKKALTKKARVKALKARVKAQKELELVFAKRYFDSLKASKIDIRSVSPSKVVVKVTKPSGVSKQVTVNRPKVVSRQGGGSALSVVSGRQVIVLQEPPVTIPAAVAVKGGITKQVGGFASAVLFLGKVKPSAKVSSASRFSPVLKFADRNRFIDLFDRGVVSSSIRISKRASASKIKPVSKVKPVSKTRSVVKSAQSVILRSAQDLGISSRQLQLLQRVLKRANKRVPKKVIRLLRRPKFRLDKKSVRFVRDWLLSVPREYRPSLIAIFLDITSEELPDDITGLAIRPVIVRKRLSKKKGFKSSSKKKKPSKKKKRG